MIDLPFKSFVRAIGLSAIAVLAGVTASLLFRAEPPPAALPGAQVVAMGGLSPLASLGVKPGDVVEGARQEGDELVIYLVRDGERLTVRARGVTNPFVKELLLNPQATHQQ